MNRRMVSLAASILMAGAFSAQAVVIDFEALRHNDNVNRQEGRTYTEDGFLLSQVEQTGPTFRTFGTAEGRFSGSTALFNDAIGGSTTLTKVGGGLFDVFSIDLAELNGNNVASVTFVDNDGDSITFRLDGIAFGAQTFAFDNRFLGISSLTWRQDSPFHQFDNICINDPNCHDIPEPAPLALLGLAAVAAGAARRRRHPQSA